MGSLKASAAAFCLIIAGGHSAWCEADHANSPAKGHPAMESSAEDHADDSQEPVTLVAVGDIRLDGPVGRIIDKLGAKAPTAQVKKDLAGDIIFGNLECAITQRGQKVTKIFNFRSPPGHLSAVKAAGFTVVNLANNHVMDFDAEGLSDTIKALDQIKMPHIGAGMTRDKAFRPWFVKVHGIKIGFMGMTSTFPTEAWARASRAGVAGADFKKFPDYITSAKKKCDLLIVSFHGGTELDPGPNDVQHDFARAAIDAGADLIIAHHPHVVQPVEIYKDKYILYSIGNFMFVSPSPLTRWSVISRITLNRSGVEHIEFVPVETWYGQVHPASSEGIQAMREALNRLGALDARPGLLSVRGAVPEASKTP